MYKSEETGHPLSYSSFQRNQTLVSQAIVGTGLQSLYSGNSGITHPITTGPHALETSPTVSTL